MKRRFFSIPWWLFEINGQLIGTHSNSLDGGHEAALRSYRQRFPHVREIQSIELRAVG